MSFALQQIAWWFIRPSNLVFLLICTAGLLFWLDRNRSARLLLSGVVALLLGIAILPVRQMLALPLESRFPVPETLPQTVDGIIVLGGVADAQTTASWGQVALGQTAERLTASVLLARRYPSAELVFTSGATQLKGVSEAAIAKQFYENFGIDPARLVLEHRARNTYENMHYSQELVQPKAGERWLLVTSATHMPRAVGVFRAAGWEILPYPVDFTTHPGSFRPTANVLEELLELDYVVREWAALIGYRLFGYTDVLFPAP